MNDVTEPKVVRERAAKIYVVTDRNSGEKVLVKAKTRTAVGEYLVNQHFEIEMLAPKNMDVMLNAVSTGAQVHEI